MPVHAELLEALLQSYFPWYYAPPETWLASSVESSPYGPMSPSYGVVSPFPSLDPTPPWLAPSPLTPSSDYSTELAGFGMSPISSGPRNGQPSDYGPSPLVAPLSLEAQIETFLGDPIESARIASAASGGNPIGLSEAQARAFLPVHLQTAENILKVQEFGPNAPTNLSLEEIRSRRVELGL